MSATQIQFFRQALANAIERLPVPSSAISEQATANALLISTALSGALASSEPELSEKICQAIGISNNQKQVQA